MNTHNRRPCRVSRRELLEWLAVLGVAGERHLLLALDCRTWGREQSFHDAVHWLLAQGVVHQTTHAHQRLFYTGQRCLYNMHGAIGLADLTVAVDRSLRWLGYSARWMNTCPSSREFTCTGLVLYHTLPDSPPSACIVHYGDEQGPVSQAIGRLRALSRLSHDVRRFWGIAQVCVLASFDLWPLAPGERWLAALVQTMKNGSLYATSHVYLLDTPAPYALTTSIWHHCDEAERTSVKITQEAT